MLSILLSNWRIAAGLIVGIGLVFMGTRIQHKIDMADHEAYVLEVERTQKRVQDELQNEINKALEEKRKVSADLEEALKKQKVVIRTVTKTVEKEIEKPIYRDCVLPDSGVRLLNKTASDYNSNR